MLQRKQTIWLLLAALLTALTFKFPFYSVAENTSGAYKNVIAMDAIYTILSGIATAVLCVVAVFLYRGLKLQLQVTLLAAVCSLLHIVLLYVSSVAAGKGGPMLTALLPVAAFLLIIAAARGIRMDKRTLEEAYRNRLR